MKTAIIFITHIMNGTIDRQIKKLSEQTKGKANFFVGYQADKVQLVLPEGVNSFPFTIKGLNRLGYRTWGCTLMDGNFHFVMLDFYRQHPEYDYFWLIEYDVRFNGHWQEFFSFFKDKEEDFISAHIETVSDNPNWMRWNEMETINLQTDRNNLLKSFNPICRFSHRALALLHERCSLGDRGHNEVLMPTLFHHFGLKIADFGGRGRYSFKDYPDLFYQHDPNDPKENKYTHRFRPAHQEDGLELKNMIYHPIK